MPGLFSPVTSGLFGEVGEIGGSGAFQGIGKLGKAYSEFLFNRLMTNPADTDLFRLGTEAIRDSVGGVAGAQRQRLGNAANTGGFLDSGSVSRGLADIDRAELESFAGSERDLLIALFDRQDEGVFPYLSGGSNEAMNVARFNAGIEQSEKNASMSLFSDMFLS